MAIYHYRARNQQNGVEDGVLEATDERDVAVRLRQKGLYPTAIKKELGRPKSWTHQSVTRKAFFFQQMHALLASGRSLQAALAELSPQLSTSQSARMAASTAKNETGPLVKILADTGGFSTYELKALREGEKRGELLETLQKLADAAPAGRTAMFSYRIAGGILLVSALLLAANHTFGMLKVGHMFLALVYFNRDIPAGVDRAFFISIRKLGIGLLVGYIVITYGLRRGYWGGRSMGSLSKWRPMFLRSSYFPGSNLMASLVTSSSHRANLAMKHAFDHHYKPDEALDLASEWCKDHHFQGCLTRARQLVREGKTMQQALFEAELPGWMISDMLEAYRTGFVQSHNNEDEYPIA